MDEGEAPESELMEAVYQLYLQHVGTSRHQFSRELSRLIDETESYHDLFLEFAKRRLMPYLITTCARRRSRERAAELLQGLSDNGRTL